MRQLSGILLICLVYSACTSEQAPKPAERNFACDTAVITSARIYTIIQQNCTNYNCHPGGGSPVGANFSSLANLRSFISTRGGDFSVRVTGPGADMPQSQGFPEMPQAVRDSIACWISKGMPD